MYQFVILLLHTILLIKLINTSVCSGRFLLSCVEWMAFGTDLNVDALLRGACNKCIATVACNICLMVIWMDSFSHDFHLFIFLSFSVISLPTDSGSCHTLYTRMPDPHMILITRATLSSVYIPINSLIIVT